MLLPFFTVAQSGQQKQWPFGGLSPTMMPPPVQFPVQHSRVGFGQADARRYNGITFTSLILPDQPAQRSGPVFSAPTALSVHTPTAFSKFSPAAPVISASISQTAAAQEPSTIKKGHVFRPWEAGELRGPAKRSPVPAPTQSSPQMACAKPCTGISSKVCTVHKRKSLSNSDIEDADQSKSAFELFATNLGKSPEGHRCLYCGKIYSRKYGLKIHLRTHTGFKPLKCKVCQRPFGDPSNLNKHVRLHADVLLAEADAKKSVFKNVQSAGYNPQVTDNVFSKNNTSQQHRNFSIFNCPFCGRNLVRKRDLERHLASRHPGEQLVDVESV